MWSPSASIRGCKGMLCQTKSPTIGPLQTAGASFSIRNPIDMHFTPKFSNGSILDSADEQYHREGHFEAAKIYLPEPF